MEIGSIIELNTEKLFSLSAGKKEIVFPFMKNTFYHLKHFNTGRSAIEALFNYLHQQRGVDNVFVPCFICSSVIDALKRSKVKITPYKVNKDLTFDIKNISCGQNDVIYACEYFGKGFTQEVLSTIKGLQNKGVTVVQDITLNLLANGEFFIFGDYIIGSERKWFAIPDGGFIASKSELPDFKIVDEINDYTLYYLVAQLMKSEYLKNANLDKNEYLNYYKKATECLFSDYTVRSISKISENLLKQTDFDFIAKKRIKNYDFLFNAFSKFDFIRPLERESDSVPMGMVVMTNERDSLFNYLVANDVYCNIHWRENNLISLYEDSKYVSETVLTIPCDQRYGIDDLNRVVELVKSYKRQ